MDDPHVYAVSELLGVPHDLLIKKLTLKLFSIGSPTRGSVREIPMTVNVAMQNRDALAKVENKKENGKKGREEKKQKNKNKNRKE